jgi:hypothetical protein
MVGTIRELERDGRKILLMRRPMRTYLIGFFVAPFFVVAIPILALLWCGSEISNFWIALFLGIATLGYLTALYLYVDFMRDRPQLIVSDDSLTCHLPHPLFHNRRSIPLDQLRSLLRFDVNGGVTDFSPWLPHRLDAVLRSGERVPLTEAEDMAAMKTVNQWLQTKLLERGITLPTESRTVKLGEQPAIEDRPFGCKNEETDPPVFSFPSDRTKDGAAVTIDLHNGQLRCERRKYGSIEARCWPLDSIGDIRSAITSEEINEDWIDFADLNVHLLDGTVSRLVAVTALRYMRAEEMAWIATVLRRALPSRDDMPRTAPKTPPRG